MPRATRCVTCFLVAILSWAAVPLVAQAPAAAPATDWLARYRPISARLIQLATADSFAWQRLAELTDTFGSRFSGSDNLARAIAWAAETMKKDGLDNVRTERVMVPKWVRGAESAVIVDPPLHQMAVLGLGGGIPTPPGGVEGEVILVGSFEELRGRAADVPGKIVLLNAPFTSYSDTVTYRTTGARTAAQYGAVAVLVRAVGPEGLRTPHTGSVNYVPETMAIPAAAIAAEDANRISRLIARGRHVRVRLTLDSHQDPDAESANVVGEIQGRERPHEVVLLGAHLDSWDVGAGASDDGVGCIATWEALRLMKRMNLQPRRTVRVVLFTNEENGLRGAAAYARKYAASAGDHVFALESDSGAFWPPLLGFSGSQASRQAMREIVSLLAPLGFRDVVAGGGGADIGPIAQLGGAPTMAYIGDPTNFFAIHHTAADTVERIPREDVSRAAAAIAVISYVVADMPERLPR